MAQPRVEPTPDPIYLDRRLGPLDAAAIIVSNVIGGGILFTPPQIAASVPHAWLFLSTWVAGGLLASAGAMAAANTTPFFTIAIVPGMFVLNFSPQTIVAVAAIFAMAWIHLRGVRPGRIVGNSLAARRRQE